MKFEGRGPSQAVESFWHRKFVGAIFSKNRSPLWWASLEREMLACAHLCTGTSDTMRSYASTIILLRTDGYQLERHWQSVWLVFSNLVLT